MYKSCFIHRNNIFLYIYPIRNVETKVPFSIELSLVALSERIIEKMKNVNMGNSLLAGYVSIVPKFSFSNRLVIIVS